MTTFESKEPVLHELLAEVDRGRIQLPDFQRPWVWPDGHIRALIASVSLSYPIGAVMLMQTGGQGVRFKPRPLHGAESAIGTEPDRLLLDGQQRLTSLYGALYSRSPVRTQDEKQKPLQRFYYLKLDDCLNPDVDRIDAIISVDASKLVTTNFGREILLDLRTPEKEYELGYIPASSLLRQQDFLTWQNGFNQFFGQDPQKMMAVNQFQMEIWMRFLQFKVPVIELLRGTPKEAVCAVFEKVNTGGVALTVFELMTATFAADDFALREDWERRRERLHAVDVLTGAEGTDFLQAVALLASYERHLASGGSKAVSVKRRDVLRLELAEYQACAERIEEGMLRAGRLLNQQFVLDKRNLPYSSQLVPMAAISAALGKEFDTVAAKEKLARWYWCGVFGEMYGGANESRFANDIVDVVAWIREDGPEPRTVRDASFAPQRLLTMQTRQSAAYKGALALFVRHGSHDFINGDAIALSDGFAIPVEIHHLFPRAWATKRNLPSRRWNSVVNKAPLTARTNKLLRGDAPSKYLGRVEDAGAVDSGALDTILRSHFIEPTIFRADDFEGFLRDRAKRLLDAIERVMGKPVQGRDSEGVVEDFGGPLTWTAEEIEAGRPREVLFDRYEVVDVLTAGGMSQVYHCIDRENDQAVCVKQVLVEGPDAQALGREQSIYQRLMNAYFPHCLEVRDFVREGRWSALVMEWADGGTLESYVEAQPLGRLDTTETHAIAQALISALADLHALDVVHRDLKPANVLRVGDVWKLGDFGIAKQTSRLLTRATMQQFFTPGYAPPEQAEGVEAKASADVYALGKVLTFLLTGGTDPDRITYPGWASFVRRCVAADAEDRPSLDVLRAELAELAH